MRVKPYTKLSFRRLAKLYELASKAPPGAVVECGVWNGGSAAMMAHAAPDRPIWLFDSWQGLPEPGPLDRLQTGETRAAGENLGSQQRVRHVMRPFADVHLVRGWFHETLPVARNRIGPIAVLHIDSDWYESIAICLRELYDHVAPGGYVVVDDYGRWMGARKAVEEFATPRNIDLTSIDHAVHWRKDEAREQRIRQSPSRMRQAVRS